MARKKNKEVAVLEKLNAKIAEKEAINNEIKSKCFLIGDKVYGISLFESDITLLKAEVRQLIEKRAVLENPANGPQNLK